MKEIVYASKLILYLIIIITLLTLKWSTIYEKYFLTDSIPSMLFF